MGRKKCVFTISLDISTETNIHKTLDLKYHNNGYLKINIINFLNFKPKERGGVQNTFVAYLFVFQTEKSSFGSS